MEQTPSSISLSAGQQPNPDRYSPGNAITYPKSPHVSFPESIYLLHTQEPWCKYISTDHVRSSSFHPHVSNLGMDGKLPTVLTPVGPSTLRVDPVPQ